MSLPARSEEGLALYKSIPTESERKCLGMSRALTKTGHFYEAKKLLKKANKQFPESPSLLNAMGILHADFENYKEAIIYYDFAILVIEDWDNHHWILFNKGQAFYALGCYENEISIFKKLIVIKGSAFRPHGCYIINRV